METTKTEKIITISYFILLAALVVFMIYISLFESTEMYEKRVMHDVRSFEETSSSKVLDEDAPLGFHEEFEFDINEATNECQVIAFYERHSLVQVYFNDTLMFSIRPNAGNRLIRTTGCQWVVVPIYESDNGKTVRIVISPVYRSASGQRYTFFVGPRTALYKNRFIKDFPQLLLSMIAIIMGLVFMLASYISTAKGNNRSHVEYVGLFSFFMGAWKLTDCRFITLIVPGIPAFLSYFSITILMVGTLPLMYFIKKGIRSKAKVLLNISSAISVVAISICLILQVLGLFDFRQTLVFVHIGIISAIASITVCVISDFLHEKDDPRVKMTMICYLLCAVGGALDVAVFYVNTNSSGILFTLMAFLVYIVLNAIFNGRDLEMKANKDSFTGLSNRSRCNDILEDPMLLEDDTGLIVFDLNDLKLFNDTWGHDQGDKLILAFAKVLRKVIPTDQFLGRYGGDEFIAICFDADSSDMGKIITDVEKEVRTVNNSGGNIKISYSAGYAVSDEFDKCTMMDLFKKADERMFKEKKAYHRRRAFGG